MKTEKNWKEAKGLTQMHSKIQGPKSSIERNFNTDLENWKTLQTSLIFEYKPS